MLKKILFSTLLLSSAILFIACSEEGDDSPNPALPLDKRSFYMGFTPWPYAATQAAIDDVYEKIQNHGDIIAHHLDGGIPWQELNTSIAYNNSVENELTSRINATDSEQVVYLAVSPLNSARDGMAEHWGSSTGEALTPPWDSYDFNNSAVINAYTAFSLDLIARFDPKYFNYGIEINELMINEPAKFDAYVTFIKEVHDKIKTVHPTLPLMVSITLKMPGSAEMETTKNGFSRIAEYVDLVGVSSYGYIFYGHADAGDSANLPIDWFSQINVIAPTKPVAIAETGWIAEDLTIAAYSVDTQSDEDKQNAYVRKMLAEANTLDAAFVVWFSVVDFDDLWSNTLGEDDLSKIWKDTGLYDEGLNERKGLESWDEWLQYGHTD